MRIPFNRFVAVYELGTAVIPIFVIIGKIVLGLLYPAPDTPDYAKGMDEFFMLFSLFFWPFTLPSVFICLSASCWNWIGEHGKTAYIGKFLDICLFVLGLYYLTSSNVSPDNYLLCGFALIPVIGRPWVVLLEILILANYILRSTLKPSLKKALLIIGASVLLFLAFNVPVYDFPIPKENIPKNINPEIIKYIEKFYSPNALERLSAIKKLRAKGKESAPAIPFLIQAMRDIDEIRLTAEEALIEMGEISIEPLTTAFQDAKIHPDVRYNAVYTLARMKDSKTLDSLALALNQQDWRIRSTAVWGLWGLKNSRPIPLLIECLGDKNEEVREEALKALRNVTKEELGLDQKSWQEWWQRNRDTLNGCHE